jgi:oxygen-independent coproporphyrinogen-3 oxidase
MAAEAPQVTEELLRELDKPGPRYTSYPTAPNFTDAFRAADLEAALGRLGAADPAARPLSLYVHLPFCAHLCLFCACNTVITRKPGVASRYLDALEGEIGAAARALGSRRRVTQLHLGGGTPTYLTVAELERLHAMLAKAFDIAPDAEKAVEVDPRVTTAEQLEALAAAGFNRASLGVQDFADDVQRAVNRVQPVDETRAILEAARRLGFRGLNIDLIYGLPLQRLETFRRTIDEVLAMRPDRIALYSYAHVPWIRPGQGGFELHQLPMPSAAEKIGLFRHALSAFAAAGYRHLGMDHFALPEDELAQALERGTLHRNFQGYTVRRAEDLLGLGQSAISDLAGVYAQNEKDNARYEETARAGRLTTVRGLALSDEDARRRRAILAIMCEGRLEGERARGFEREIQSLAPLEARGLVARTADGVRVTALGRLFLRNIAMAFDAYLQAGTQGGSTSGRGDAAKPTFSRTV